jgi:coenzyme F420-reducing hydrogenase beta subunit
MVEFQTRSKYLEPSPPDYKQIKLDVMSGRTVLFAGTPCQVAAVKDAVGTAANLVTVSLVCHAMPSAAEWRKYLTSLEKQHNSYTVYVNQRYGVQELYIVMLNGHVVYKPGQNEWVKKFISDKSVIRPSCLTCEFKYPNIRGDFIIGDSWGIDKKANGIQSGKAGTVFFISERAQDLFNEISPQLKFKQIDTE